MNLTLEYLPAPVVLDSGTAASILPAAIVQNIYTTFGAIFNLSLRDVTCPCSLAKSDATINFHFVGKIIHAPIREFVRQASVLDSMPGEGACIFDLAPEYGQFATYLLGDSFLRSAYVVYDLSNNKIALAQTVFDATTSDIMEIVNGTDGIPSVPGSTVTAKITLPLATVGVTLPSTTASSVQ